MGKDHMNKVVAISGKFDPPHDGHIAHIVRAARLGNYLHIIVQPDEVVKMLKGKCQLPFWARCELLNGILCLNEIKGKTVRCIDDDGSSVRTLKLLRPHIYAKGGDRTPDNMIQTEIDACNEIGCRIVYGVGDKINSSSKIEVVKCMVRP